MIGYYLSFSFQGGIMEALNAIVSEINGFLWSSVIIILLILTPFFVKKFNMIKRILEII